MSAIRLLPTARTYASLAVDGPANATWNTVLEAAAGYEGPAGNAVTFTATADGSGTGSITVSGTAVTFHFANTVTLVSDFEAALAASAAASALMRVKTAGTTQGYALLSAGDAFAATNLAGGGALTSAAPTLTDATLGVPRPFKCDEALLLLRSDNGSGTMTATGTLWGYSEVAAIAQWYPIGAISGGGTLAEIAADKLAYVELIRGLRGFSRFYFQIGALGGTATEVEVWLDCVPADSTTN